MSNEKQKLSEFNKRAAEAEKWAGGGKDAYNLAIDEQFAEMNNTRLPATPKNIATTISGAVRMFFDGMIEDEEAKKYLEKNGLDMNNLRKHVVEKTLIHAIPDIVNNGDIERLAKLGILAGEKIDPGATGANTVVRYITPEEDKETLNHIESVIGTLPDTTNKND